MAESTKATDGSTSGTVSTALAASKRWSPVVATTIGVALWAR